MGGNAGGANCLFPFVYKNVSYKECIRPANKEPWCATTNNFDVDETYGICKNLIVGN